MPENNNAQGDILMPEFAAKEWIKRRPSSLKAEGQQTPMMRMIDGSELLYRYG
jgi:hypothetical protein